MDRVIGHAVPAPYPGGLRHLLGEIPGEAQDKKNRAVFVTPPEYAWAKPSAVSMRAQYLRGEETTKPVPGFFLAKFLPGQRFQQCCLSKKNSKPSATPQLSKPDLNTLVYQGR